MTHLQNPASGSLLGSYHFPKREPSLFEGVWQLVQRPAFRSLSERMQGMRFHSALLAAIQEAKSPAFLLPELLGLYDRIWRGEVFRKPIGVVHFEFWLNHFSGLSFEEERQVRGKIVGKYLPREAFQTIFPIGMQRIYPGTHFVVAHLSPDVDTMTASFWGWMDAFGAKIGTGQHLWVLPGGAPDSAFTKCFSDQLGRAVFDVLATPQPMLSLKATDLLTQQGLVKKEGSCLTVEIDHAAEKQAVILVDQEGHYLGDWRSSDIEPVGQVTLLFKTIVRWFGSRYLADLVSCLSSSVVSQHSFQSRCRALLQSTVREADPFLDFEERQKERLHLLLQVGLKIKEGVDASFETLFTVLIQLGAEGIGPFLEIGREETKLLFDEKGALREERTAIFGSLEQMLGRLDCAILSARNFIERLDLAIVIKRDVLLQPLVYIRGMSDVEEMREKIRHHPSLTVVEVENEEKLVPIGVVFADTLMQKSLGTVSFRDFSNPQEAKMASYLDLISIVDHHKSGFKTGSIPTVLVGDAQSCNVLLAEESFQLNDRYGVGGLSQAGLAEQLQEVAKETPTSQTLRIWQRLLQRQMVYHESAPYYVHREREFVEYLTFLYAILDDTDLLSKVSDRDVEAVAQLLNRLKSLSLGREADVVSLQDLPRDATFAKIAATRLLKQADLYSLYQTVYAMRDKEVAEALQACVDVGDRRIFTDTKELNGCARVGQIKLFSSHFAHFSSQAPVVQQVWLHASQEAFLHNSDLLLHMQMISTIPSAEDVYSSELNLQHLSIHAGDKRKRHAHQDEIWIWLPNTHSALDLLQHFLSSFSRSLKDRKEVQVALLGDVATAWEPLFREYLDVEEIDRPASMPVGMGLARLRFPAGRFNSRKSAVSVHLPATIPA